MQKIVSATALAVLVCATPSWGYAWSVALDTKTGAMSTTLVNRGDVIVLFGSCTPS
jgi:hypothetical protein